MISANRLYSDASQENPVLDAIETGICADRVDHFALSRIVDEPTWP
jgi:hypothetical protein